MMSDGKVTEKIREQSQNQKKKKDRANEKDPTEKKRWHGFG